MTFETTNIVWVVKLHYLLFTEGYSIMLLFKINLNENL